MREAPAVLECVVNVSEGRDVGVLADLAAVCGGALLDVHRDAHHHRAVFTLVGEEAPRRLTRAAIERLDLSDHSGVHPRLGVVDVVPFVALDGSTDAALAARDRFAAWLAGSLEVPVFLYGHERTLPEVRRRAFADLEPDLGPPRPHPRAGATCVGHRDVLVAYNVWLRDGDVAVARQVAAAVRGPALRALGLEVGGRAQVSMNLVAPRELGPAEAYDAVRRAAEARGDGVAGAELVGLVPAAVLDAVPRRRWPELDLDADRTIEARSAGATPA